MEKFIGKKNCLQCDKEFEAQSQKVFEERKFCSLSCSSKYNNKHGGGFTNKKHSEIFKLKMSLRTKGDKNPSKRKEIKEKISQKLKGRDTYWLKGKKKPKHSNLMRKFVIEHRPIGFGDRIGSEHPNWKGGISFEPYSSEWRNELKEFIKERDNYQCQNPNCSGRIKKLTIHHINYDKKIVNLIIL